MPAIGPIEIIVVLVIALLIVGPKKLPGLGRSVGNGVRGFKETLSFGSESSDTDDPQTEIKALKKP